MGLFQRFKGSNNGDQPAKEARQLRRMAARLSADQLGQLPDQELFEVLNARVQGNHSKAEEIEILNQLEGPARTFYLLTVYDREIYNGGLCQFFVNSSRFLAPYVSEAMKTIGAQEYAGIYDDFISRHRVDPKNLLSFRIQDLSEYEGQAARYPFDHFDRAYYEQTQIRSLKDILLAYARDHLDRF